MRPASSGESPGITADEMKKIQTTVYRLPGAGFAEKDGTFTNSARWLQWKNAALAAARAIAGWTRTLWRRFSCRVRELYKKEGGKFPDPILNLTLELYGPVESVSCPKSLKEINGKALADLDRSGHKAADQSRAAIAGICLAEGRRHHVLRQLDLFADAWTEAGNMTARRDRRILPGWAFTRIGHGPGRPTGVCFTTARHATWMANRWIPTRKQVWWNEATQKWAGNDVPDFKPDSKPTDHMGPFIMNAEGVGRIFGAAGGVCGWTVPGILRTDGKPDR